MKRPTKNAEREQYALEVAAIENAARDLRDAVNEEFDQRFCADYEYLRDVVEGYTPEERATLCAAADVIEELESGGDLLVTKEVALALADKLNAMLTTPVNAHVAANRAAAQAFRDFGCDSCGVTMIEGRGHKIGCPELTKEAAPVAAHTPGPWKSEYDAYSSLGLVTGPGGCYICIVNDEGEETDNEANARLIAAAPETAAERDALKEINKDLLAALKDALEQLERPAGTNIEAAAVKARAAILRATEGK